MFLSNTKFLSTSFRYYFCRPAHLHRFDTLACRQQPAHHYRPSVPPIRVAGGRAIAKIQTSNPNNIFKYRSIFKIEPASVCVFILRYVSRIFMWFERFFSSCGYFFFVHNCTRKQVPCYVYRNVQFLLLRLVLVTRIVVRAYIVIFFLCFFLIFQGIFFNCW